MPYTNITESTVVPIGNYVHQNFVLDQNAGCFEKHLSSRAANLLLIPTSFITAALDTIIGIGLGAGACLTGGLTRLNEYSINHVGSSRFLLACPFLLLMRTIIQKYNLAEIYQ